MMSTLSQIYDHLRELMLHYYPSSLSSPRTGAALASDNSTSTDPLILNYLPLLILLALFWPIIITLIAASITASAWLFWLCIGATTGIVQFIYVLYNFAMITWDLIILVLLKTFSMLRSILRRYYYKAVFATYKSMGIERRSRNNYSTGDGKNETGVVRRRRKEWSQEVGRATNYKQFSEIEIYEPMMSTTTSTVNNSGDGKQTRPNSIRRTMSAGMKYNSNKHENSSSKFGVGLRRRRRPSSQELQSEQDGEEEERDNQTTPSSPINSVEESPSSTPTGNNGSPIRKIHSCLEFKRQPSSSSSKISILSSTSSSTTRGSRTRGRRKQMSPITRTYSSSSLRNIDELECIEDEYDNVDDDDDESSCPKRQNIVTDDLGMEGSMLLTTLARLKEARVQASLWSDDHSAVADNNDSNKYNQEDDDKLIMPNLSSLSKEEEEEEEQRKNNNSESSYHITASFKTIRPKGNNKKKWNEDYSSSLKTLLTGIVKRNHLSIENWLIQDARSVAERGQHSLRKETRDAIDSYGDEVERCIDWIARGPVYLCPVGGAGGSADEEDGDEVEKKKKKPMTSEDVMEKQREELVKRMILVKRMKQNVGHTALMLSGGGAITMYHLGAIKALVESGVYEHIHVISGTSGGSISAAMCAIKTPSELLRDICVRTVSTDYMLTGEQKKKNIRWFPKILDMGAHFFKNGVVCDANEFKRCCEFYYKDITFEEAYEMTRKHVCITVTASRASSGKGLQRLLLNHISTPNVTLASAVRASCALPGVFTPAALMIKDSRGKVVPFEVDGVEWIDGSVQADIPVKRISTLFNVSNYVVSQTNIHVVPFIHKSHHPSINSLYWKLFQFFMNDAGHRLSALSDFNLLPKFFGNDLGKMFKQRYYGDLTLVPKFTTSHKFGLKLLSNPTEKDMDIYLQGGQEAAWPFIRVLQEMLHLERSIDTCLKELGERLRSVTSGLEDVNLSNDDVDSVSSVVGASNRARLPGLGREAELLRGKVKDLEQENEQLKKKVQRLQRALGIAHPKPKNLSGPLGQIVSVDEGEGQGEE